MTPVQNDTNTISYYVFGSFGCVPGCTESYEYTENCDLLDWYRPSCAFLLVPGFLDPEEGSLLSSEVCYRRLPEFPKAHVTVLHMSEFLERAPGKFRRNVTVN